MAYIWIIVILIILGIFLISLYNRLIKVRNRNQEAWSDIDVQLKRRYDLIPNLVDTVKGYAKHEKDVFENVTELRTNAINASGTHAKAEAENMLTGALKSIFAVSENYPDLKANENFLQLQKELVDTEDKIQAARRFFNSTVEDLNTAIQTFPSNIFAGMLGFKAEEFFEVAEGEKEAVKVSF